MLIHLCETISTKLHSLVVLQCLKARFPTARGLYGHHLFLSAIMLTSKVICDDTYSNISQSIVSQSNMFQLCEINQMECEMCQYLGSRYLEGIRRHGLKGFHWLRAISYICPSNHLRACCDICQPLPRCRPQ